MPLVQTRGAASAQGFGEFAQATVANYIESVFSTYLWAGNSSSQSINIGFDLTTTTAMTWFKDRTNPDGAGIVNNVTGLRNVSYSTDAASNPSSYFQFTSTGYNLPTATINTTGSNYVGWTFRKQPKFFDVVTYTGTGSNRTIAHSLGSVPGSIIVKRTDTAAAWAVYHRSLANTEYLVLNSTAAKATGATRWNSTTPTSTVFSVGTDASVNASGATYVAYLFAHDAGGFGLTGTDNVISCGSFTSAGPSTDVTVTLGYEPQWIMVKNATVSADWGMYDVMRGMSNTNTAELLANKSNAETNTTLAYFPRPTATGFIAKNSLGADSGNNIIYIAIRRGPMKVPTLGTSVFKPMTTTGDGNSVRSFTGVGFPPDLVFPIMRASPGNHYLGDRLRGSPILETTSTVAENSGYVKSYDQDGWTTQSDAFGNNFNFAFIDYLFRRAPGFFDEVCYTGNGSVQNVTHNLTVVPELMIVKNRTTATYNWFVYSAALGNDSRLLLNTTAAASGGSFVWDYTSPTSSVFTVGASSNVNGSGENYVAYLFATCAGVSKVGSYTGNGTTQTINCGFGAGGARFVLIKATSTTGNWMVFDTSRGMTVLTDPFLSLNSTAAETATLGACTTVSTGFALNESILTGVNTSSVSFVFLAIA